MGDETVPRVGRAKTKVDKDIIISASERYNLDQIDLQILRLVIKHPMISNVEIGELLGGWHRNAIAKRRNKPAFVAALEDATGSAQRHLKEAARLAAMRLKQMVNDPDKSIALQAMKMALARYINKAEVEVSMKPVVRYETTVTPDGSLVQKLIDEELAKDEGVIDVEVRQGDDNEGGE